jgi:hypothetical protein
MQATDQPNLPIVDYLAAADKPSYPRRQRVTASVKAFALVAIATVVGLALYTLFPGKTSPCVYAIPFIWTGAAWYVGARVAESKSPLMLKVMKGSAAVVAVLLSPFLLCHSPTAPSTLSYLVNYGWKSRAVSDDERIGVVFLVGSLSLFALGNLADLLIWRNRRAREHQTFIASVQPHE